MPTCIRPFVTTVVALALRAGEAGAQQTARDSTHAMASVQISGFRFDPARLVVRPGTRVRFDNADEIEHTVTFGTPGATDTRLTSATFERRGALHVVVMPARGSFAYHCARHPFMTGTLLVSDSVAAGGSSAAAGSATATQHHRPARPGPAR